LFTSRIPTGVADVGLARGGALAATKALTKVEVEEAAGEPRTRDGRESSHEIKSAHQSTPWPTDDDEA
jgi:hypothetical protein